MDWFKIHLLIAKHAAKYRPKKKLLASIFLLFLHLWKFSFFHIVKDFSFQIFLFLLYINYLPDDVICNIGIYADDATLYSKCDQGSDLWQQLELASELESDLRDSVTWDR